MAKNTKDESLDLFYFNEENASKKTKRKSKKSSKNIKGNNNNKVKSENTKDEKFNFNEEIIIGLKRIDKDEDKPKKGKTTEKNVKRHNNQIKQSKDILVSQQRKMPNKKQINSKLAQRKLTPEQELARRKKKAIFRIVKWATLLCIIIAGVVYTLLSPIFNIKTIQVSGNSKISIDEIISLSKIEIEQNIFQYKEKEIAQQIKTNAYIDAVQVKRKIPDTIEIIVTERQSSFMIKFANANALINNQGYILEITERKENLPVIVGIVTEQENIQTGNRLCTKDLEKLGDVLRIMESATSNGLSTFITQIDITSKDDYVLILQKKKKIVHLGDTSNLSTKMLWILNFNETEKDKQGEIILNMNLNDERNNPYFREAV